MCVYMYMYLLKFHQAYELSRSVLSFPIFIIAEWYDHLSVCIRKEEVISEHVAFKILREKLFWLLNTCEISF